MRIRIFSVAAVVALGAVSAALAQPRNMNLTINTADGSSWNWQNAGQPGNWIQDSTNPNQWSISGNVSRPSYDFGFNLTLDPDPFIANSFTITNPSAITQTYTVVVTLPIAPVVPFPSQTLGGVSGTLVDFNGSGDAQIATAGPGTAIYTALIDGADYQQLLPHSFSFNTPSFLPDPFGPSVFGPLSGQPGAFLSIGIRNTFTLSPGDSVGLTSTFLLVPTPGAMGLLALGGLVATRRRR